MSDSIATAAMSSNSTGTYTVGATHSAIASGSTNGNSTSTSVTVPEKYKLVYSALYRLDLEYLFPEFLSLRMTDALFEIDFDDGERRADSVRWQQAYHKSNFIKQIRSTIVMAVVQGTSSECVTAAVIEPQPLERRRSGLGSFQSASRSPAADPSAATSAGHAYGHAYGPAARDRDRLISRAPLVPPTGPAAATGHGYRDRSAGSDRDSEAGSRSSSILSKAVSFGRNNQVNISQFNTAGSGLTATNTFPAVTPPGVTGPIALARPQLQPAAASNSRSISHSISRSLPIPYPMPTKLKNRIDEFSKGKLVAGVPFKQQRNGEAVLNELYHLLQLEFEHQLCDSESDIDSAASGGSGHVTDSGNSYTNYNRNGVPGSARAAHEAAGFTIDPVVGANQQRIKKHITSWLANTRNYHKKKQTGTKTPSECRKIFEKMEV